MKKRAHKVIAPSEAIAHIKSTFSNTIITVTDREGNCIAWSTGGSCGFKGPRRGSAYAAQVAAETVGKKVLDLGVKSLYIFLQGFGDGRESSVRGLASQGLSLVALRDITPVSYNGCKMPKRKCL